MASFLKRIHIEQIFLYVLILKPGIHECQVSSEKIAKHLEVSLDYIPGHKGICKDAQVLAEPI